MPGTASALSGSVCIVGGAGFIGSHLTDYLLDHDIAKRVTVFDNFSSGRAWHLERVAGDSRLNVVEADVLNTSLLQQALEGADVVVHLASNPDISRSVREPEVDFDQGTQLTNCVVEAMRVTGAKYILYASGSGVYGDVGTTEVGEDFGPLIPVSTYGASKLAGEALIASYAFMFEMVGLAFRFGNVVGPHQTHGVAYDFIRRLRDDPTQLQILGDGTQSKPYIHVRDVITALLTAIAHPPEVFRTYNVAPRDYTSVSDIAELVIDRLGISRDSVKLQFQGGNRGWKGDVPVVRLNTERIRALGWENEMGSLEALRSAIESMIPERRLGQR